MKRTTLLPQQQQAVIFKQKVHKMLTNSALTSRASVASKMGQSFQGRRDIYTALGYPIEIDYAGYLPKYKRQDISSRLIDAPVDGSWERKPVIKEVDGSDTQFEKEWVKLAKQFKLWSVFPRLEKLMLIGRFGILFYGLSDAATVDDLKNPVQGTPELLYVQPYGEGSVKVNSWDTNIASPRYGLPDTYSLTFHQEEGSIGTKVVVVNHTRILHVTERLLESNVYGTPALERVYNRLLNLELIVGGSAEMFWQGAFPGYAFVTKDGFDMTDSAAAIEDEIDMFVHDFKRYMKLEGLEVKNLASAITGPKEHLDAQLKMISIAEGIPLRILTGSERGELASGQDEGHWNDKLHTRRTDHIEPNILGPFIDDMIQFGILTSPNEQGWQAEWPDLNAPTDKDKAEVGKTRATAIKDFLANPEAELQIPLEQFLEEILDLDPEKVKRIMDARDEKLIKMIKDDTVEEGGLIGEEE